MHITDVKTRDFFPDREPTFNVAFSGSSDDAAEVGKVIMKQAESVVGHKAQMWKLEVDGVRSWKDLGVVRIVSPDAVCHLPPSMELQTVTKGND